MPDPTLIGLGFQGDNSNRFQSVNPNQAPGSSSFYACVLVNIQESLLTSPTEVSYFGNFNAEDPPDTFGWEIGRAADTPASDSPDTPELITLRARIGHGSSGTTLYFTTDATAMFGRTHLIGLSVVSLGLEIGSAATLYINGTAVAQETFDDTFNFNLGREGLTYGNIAGGGARSGDAVISAAYSDTDASNFIEQQRALFDGIRTCGKLAATISVLGLSAGYIYESFQQKAPISGTPTTPLKNFGTFGVNGDLIFTGSAALVINADPDPDYTGGAQSSAGGGGGGNLQDAYDAGPDGLIVLGANGPFGIDELRIGSDGAISVDSGSISVTAGNNGDGGGLLLQTDDGTGVSSGTVTIATGASNTAPAGDILFIGGAGGVVAPDGFNGGNIGGTAGDGGNATAGGLGGSGGQIILAAGGGGDATGAGATAGLGGELSIFAGGAGSAAGGAAEGVGGALRLSGGIGGTGEGGAVNISSGNGAVGSGNITVKPGSSAGFVGAISLEGGDANGLGGGPGGAIHLTGGACSNGTGQPGGAVNITGGIGDTPSNGGAVNVTGGVSDQGPGGEVNVFGGDGGVGTGGGGGGVNIGGGNATETNQSGGPVVLTGGDAVGTSGLGGSVAIDGGSSADSTGGGIRISTGVGATTQDHGSFQIGLGNIGTISSPIGGLFLSPGDNLLALRNQDFSGTETGSLLLHRIDLAGEALQTPVAGQLHYCDEQDGGDAVTVGFRAYRGGNYGLVGRAYTRTFEAADAPGDVLTVTHNLDSLAVQYAVYDPLGSKAFESVTQITGVQVPGANSIEISFASLFITAGTWRVVVLGY